MKQIQPIDDIVEREFAELCAINAAVVDLDPSAVAFRDEEVFCLSRSGQRVSFCTPDLIAGRLGALLARLDGMLRSANRPEAFAHAMSYAWMGLIAIHPFGDGNGRTSFEYIRRKLRGTPYDVAAKDFPILKRYLIKGEVQRDLHNLTMIFRTIFARAGA